VTRRGLAGLLLGAVLGVGALAACDDGTAVAQEPDAVSVCVDTHTQQRVDDSRCAQARQVVDTDDDHDDVGWFWLGMVAGGMFDPPCMWCSVHGYAGSYRTPVSVVNHTTVNNYYGGVPPSGGRISRSAMSSTLARSGARSSCSCATAGKSAPAAAKPDASKSAPTKNPAIQRGGFGPGAVKSGGGSSGGKSSSGKK